MSKKALLPFISGVGGGVKSGPESSSLMWTGEADGDEEALDEGLRYIKSFGKGPEREFDQRLRQNSSTLSCYINCLSFGYLFAFVLIPSDLECQL